MDWSAKTFSAEGAWSSSAESKVNLTGYVDIGWNIWL